MRVPFTCFPHAAALGAALLSAACATPGGPDTSPDRDTSEPSDTDVVDTDTDAVDTDATHAFTVGGSLSGLHTGNTVTLDVNGADDLTLTTDGPFTFATPLAPGATYTVTVAAEPTVPDQRCEVRRGEGTATANVTDIAVVCEGYVGRFAYIVAKEDDEVRQYAVDPDSGALTFLAKTGVGDAPSDVAVSPDGTCAYVANYGSNDVSQFRAGDDGVLVALSPPTVAAGSAPWAVTVHPSGRHLYVSNVFSDTVSQYDIGADCALTPMATPTVATGVRPAGLGVSPSGAYAYVANAASRDVSQYAIGSDGSLTPLPGPAPSYGGSSEVSRVVVDPSGEHVYLPSDITGAIYQFEVGSTGALVPLSPASVVAPSPLWLTLDPAGERAWLSTSSANILGFDIAADGTLQALPQPAATLEGGFEHWAQALVVDPSGDHLYAAAPHHAVLALDIAADGSLAAASPGWQPAGFVPWSIAFTRGTRPVTTEIGYAYVVNEGDGTISQFAVDAGGGLMPLSPPTVATGAQPASITVDPSGRYAWVANYDSRFLSQYVVEADGTLRPAPTPTVDIGVIYAAGVLLDPFGRIAFLDVGHPVRFGLTADGELGAPELTTIASRSTFGIGTSVADPWGAFVLVARLTLTSYPVSDVGASSAVLGTPTSWGGTGASGVAMDPLGQYAYVADFVTDEVKQFTVARDGTLTAMTPPTVAAGSRPASVAVDPGGRFAYVSNSARLLEPVVPGTVSQYAIGGDGSLTPLTPATVATGGQPYQVSLDPTGRYAYVANYADDTVSQYAVGADGGLVPMATATIDVGEHPRFVLVTSRRR